MTSEIGKRTGVRIYRAIDAPVLSESGLSAGADFTEQPELREVTASLVAAEGVQTLVLVQQTPEQGGLSLVYLWFKPHYPLFRHRHETDCLYIVLSGSAVMGNQTLRAGDSFFVPAAAPYSYTAGADGVEVLEIRHQVQSFTTMFGRTSDAGVAEARRTVETYAGLWKELTVSPLFAANQAAG